MKTMELAESTVVKMKSGEDGKNDLIAALAGRQADRAGAVAHRTRRVVMASLGVMQQQKAGRKRSRSVALATLLVAMLLIGPAVWRVAADLLSGDGFSDVATQLSLWFCFICLGLVAAVVVAGWARRKQ